MPKLTAHLVVRALRKLYPDAGCTLDFETPLDLLIATILSAQCTDKRVNLVTKTLFKNYRIPEDYLAVSTEELERDIHSCGTYRMKAKAIRESCCSIVQNFGGKVPMTMQELLRLRGVGRKTASVVLGAAYGVHEGIAVDTHVFRVARRLGLSSANTPAGVEQDLMRKTPLKDWATLHYLLIAHGRSICKARGHTCDCKKRLLEGTLMEKNA